MRQGVYSLGLNQIRAFFTAEQGRRQAGTRSRLNNRPVSTASCLSGTWGEKRNAHVTKMWQQLLTRGLTSCCPTNLESREEQYKAQQLTFSLILAFLKHSYFFQFIKEVIYYLFPTFLHICWDSFGSGWADRWKGGIPVVVTCSPPGYAGGHPTEEWPASYMDSFV